MVDLGWKKEKLLFERVHYKLPVIANQSADWCGNPLTIQDGSLGRLPVFRRFRKIRGIATPVCALARNDSIFVGAHA